MRVVRIIPQVRSLVGPERRRGRRIGLVPTMGALHDGHWSLVQRARKTCDRVAVSIFVNPLQFGPDEDLDAYPRSIDSDLAGCERHGCDWVFTPSPEEVYPARPLVRVSVSKLDRPLCGRARKGHFDGVLTVVCKLFNIVQPDAAFFGEKDFQQLVIIRRMVRDLDMPIEVVGCPTVREADGLAVSSRNAYLDAAQRRRAGSIAAALRGAVESVRRGQRDADRLIGDVRRHISSAQPTDIEYVEVVDPETLESVERVERDVRICVAVRFGRARLIDNMLLDAGRGAG